MFHLKSWLLSCRQRFLLVKVRQDSHIIVQTFTKHLSANINIGRGLNSCAVRTSVAIRNRYRPTPAINRNQETRRLLNTRSAHIRSQSEQSTSSKTHRRQDNKSTEPKLVQDIYQSVVFVNDDLIALNKPYGLSVYGSGSLNTKSDDPKNSREEQTDISTILQALPYLGKKFNCPDVNVGLSLKSYYSGLVLLCKNSSSKTKLDKCIAWSVAQKVQFMTYLVVTVGVPQCPHLVNLAADIKKEYMHEREMSLVCDKTIYSARKKGLMIQTWFSVKPLIINEDKGVALVEITISKDKWEAVEVLMSHYLSPVLGDHIYSRRTCTISGVPFPAGPEAAVPETQRLLPALEKAVRKYPNLSKDKPMPLFMHRHKVILNNFDSKNSPSFVVAAAPTREFMAMLRCLGLYKENVF